MSQTVQNFPSSKIRVVNADLFTAARNIMKADPQARGKTTVLNLVSDEVQGRGWEWSLTVNLAPPVFHLFSLGNPDFIIYMAELRVDEFGMTFQLQCSKHLRYGFHI